MIFGFLAVPVSISAMASIGFSSEKRMNYTCAKAGVKSAGAGLFARFAAPFAAQLPPENIADRLERFAPQGETLGRRFAPAFRCTQGGDLLVDHLLDGLQRDQPGF